MTTPDRGESSRHRRGYLFGALAVLTCPCHLPIFAVLLSGTVAAPFLTDNFGMALAILSLLFIFSLTAALRGLR
jgi:mercuric ion transport protein